MKIEWCGLWGLEGAEMMDNDRCTVCQQYTEDLVSDFAREGKKTKRHGKFQKNAALDRQLFPEAYLGQIFLESK